MIASQPSLAHGVGGGHIQLRDVNLERSVAHCGQLRERTAKPGLVVRPGVQSARGTTQSFASFGNWLLTECAVEPIAEICTQKRLVLVARLCDAAQSQTCPLPPHVVQLSVSMPRAVEPIAGIYTQKRLIAHLRARHFDSLYNKRPRRVLKTSTGVRRSLSPESRALCPPDLSLASCAADKNRFSNRPGTVPGRFPLRSEIFT